MNSSLIKDKIPLSGIDPESIISTVSRVLKLNNVVRFNVDARSSVVDFWRIPSEEENDEEPNPFRAVLKRVEMEEYSPENKSTGERQFFDMCEILEDAGCFPVFLLTGVPLQDLRKWIYFPRRSSHIAGVPLIKNADLTEGIILLCGAKTREAEPVDVTFIVKMTL